MRRSAIAAALLSLLAVGGGVAASLGAAGLGAAALAFSTLAEPEPAWLDLPPVQMAGAQVLEAQPEEMLASGDPGMRRAAAIILVARQRQLWPEGHRRFFLERAAPLAILVGAEACLPPSVMVAQAAQESGWGRSSLARRQHNLFGTKSWSDAEPALGTTEFRDGEKVRTEARFATFSTWDDSFAAQGHLLSTDPRYAPARAHVGWKSFIEQLAPVYASDPRYAWRLGWLIGRYDLDAWDELVRKAAQSGDRC